jgi:hypothetical protein
MIDPVYESERSITFYAIAEREQQARSHEGKLTAWAVLALLLVVVGIMLGGCA